MEAAEASKVFSSRKTATIIFFISLITLLISRSNRFFSTLCLQRKRRNKRNFIIEILLLQKTFPVFYKNNFRDFRDFCETLSLFTF